MNKLSILLVKTWTEVKRLRVKGKNQNEFILLGNKQAAVYYFREYQALKSQIPAEYITTKSESSSKVLQSFSEH